MRGLKLVILRKIINFIRDIHFPYFLLNKIKGKSPTLARFLKYGTLNINTEKYWDKIYHSGEYENVEEKDTLIYDGR